MHIYEMPSSSDGGSSDEMNASSVGNNVKDEVDEDDPEDGIPDGASVSKTVY